MEDDDMLKHAAIVYQAGIANIFWVNAFYCDSEHRNAKRIYQGDFRTAEAMLHGMRLAGVKVEAMACNMAGDITDQVWSTDLESAPFSDKFLPPLR